MRNLFFALLLLSSCGNVTVQGHLKDFTVHEGRATFTLGDQIYRDVGLLPSVATIMANSCGQYVEVGFYGAEITEVHLVKDSSTFNCWFLCVVCSAVALGLLLSNLPQTNPYQKHIYGGNYGGQSWWSNRL